MLTADLLQVLWAAQGPTAEDSPNSPEKGDTANRADLYLSEKDEPSKADERPPSPKRHGFIHIPQTVIFKQGHMEDWFFSKVMGSNSYPI